VETVAGSRLDVSEGHLWPRGIGNAEADALFGEGALEVHRAWLDKLGETLELLSEHTKKDAGDGYVASGLDDGYVAATGHVRGAADGLAALVGHERMCLRMMDDPDGARRALRACAGVSVTVAREMLRHVRPYRGGNFNRYGLWAPGPTVVYQEDASVVLSPRLYRGRLYIQARQGLFELFAEKFL